MADKVLAALKVAPGKTELREFSRPPVPANGGLLKVTAIGVCGADVRTYAMPLERGPFIMGHEIVGQVAEVGKAAKERWCLKEGDRILVESYRICGSCEHCLTGYFGLCPHEMAGDLIDEPESIVKFQPSRGGGYSEYYYLHSSCRFHRVPDNVSDEVATLGIALGNGWEWAYFRGGVGPGKSILILGPGQQGLGCLVAAKEAGAACIIVGGLSQDAYRLEVAKELGADYIVDVEKEDLVEKVRSLTGGAGVDVAVDVATGGASTVLPAIDVLKRRGTLVVIPGQTIPQFPMGLVQRKCIDVKGAIGHSYQAVELALKTMASNKYPLHKVTNYQFDLSDVDTAIRYIARQGPADVIHVTVSPTRERSAR
jgi:threonine dehydrogenase-like Zn-dependent dehydrogenase